MDSRLTMKKHVENVIGKTQAAVRMLYPMISRRSQLSRKNKLMIFKLGLRSIFTYASPILIEMADCHFKKLQIQQNKILKMMLNLPWRYSTDQLHLDAEIETVKEFCSRMFLNYMSGSSPM